MVNTNAASISNFACIPTLLISGVVYDMAGRRPTIIGLLILGAISTILLPVSSPSVGFFTALRAGLQVSLNCLMGNTLINDYVVLESRGKATAIMNAGVTLGNIVSILAVFTLTNIWTTKNEEYLVFGLLGGIQIITAIIMFMIVDEPIIMDAKETRRAGRKSCCGQIWSLMKQVYKACKVDPALFIGICLASSARIVVMVQQITFPQWQRSYINTLVDGKEYTAANEAQVWQI